MMNMSRGWIVLAGCALALTAGCDRGSASKETSSSGSKAEAASPADPEEGSSEKSASGDEAKKNKKQAEKGAPEPNAPSKGSGKPDLPEDLDPDETGQYGADFGIEGDPISLAKALERYRSTGDDENGAKKGESDAETGSYKVSARIDKVCKKKGCWFTLSGEEVDERVRVRMKDYGFFVPRNTDGAQAVVEGKLDQRTLSKKELRHYAKDQGKDPSEIDEEDRRRYEFTATAVKISMSS